MPSGSTWVADGLARRVGEPHAEGQDARGVSVRTGGRVTPTGKDALGSRGCRLLAQRGHCRSGAQRRAGGGGASAVGAAGDSAGVGGAGGEGGRAAAQDKKGLREAWSCFRVLCSCVGLYISVKGLC